MGIGFHPDFLAGRYRAVVESLLETRHIPDGHLASLIGALSFLGRLEEAEARFQAWKPRKSSAPAFTAARFFLGIGFTRKSDYARARKLFAENAAAAGATSAERFFVLQGRVFYSYYTGRFRAALQQAVRARRIALRTEDLYARALAADAYGQCRVVAGDVHLGLGLLKEARELALRLGNESVANSIAVSLELHEAELGLSGEPGLARLERRLESMGTEDSYSQANVGLELARQYTLRGRFSDGARMLELVAPLIYSQQNRRQEISLNLRLAELAFQRGDLFGARHFLRFLDLLLHREADATFELSALGLERKIAISEKRVEDADRLLARGQALAKDFGTTRDDNLQVRQGTLPADRENREDKIHFALQGSVLATDQAERLRPLLERGLLVAAASVAGLSAGRAGLAILPQGLGQLARDSGGVFWQPAPLSSLSARLLRRLSEGRAGKSDLVECVWGYRYDPLRHDATVYSALSALRKALGPAASQWLQGSEEGYVFSASISWPSSSENFPEAPGAPARAAELGHLASLNHRQIEILEWLRNSQRRFVAVNECKARLGVSEVTALRDLDGLRRQNLVVRTGRARATRYSLMSLTGASS